jgi:TetR/AcrR family transcriptional regulator, repressor for neighboring sulfatase
LAGKKKPKRVRRVAEDARREILDAAETTLRELGPAGIRLQQLAEEVGVSHPAILHHFGSREGLIRAVARRAIERFEFDLIAAIAAPTAADQPLGKDLIHRTFDVLVEGGHARVAAWLLLSGEGNPAAESRLRAIVEAAHARRLTLPGEQAASLEDTAFRLVLVSLVMFGEAIAGDAVRASAGIGDTGARERFRAWFADLVVGPHE